MKNFFEILDYLFMGLSGILICYFIFTISFDWSVPSNRWFTFLVILNTFYWIWRDENDAN